MPILKAQSSDPMMQSLANKKHWVLEFRYLPAKSEAVSFLAVITQFADSFQSAWQDEDVFGRMDSVSTFKNVKRTLALGWDVPAFSEIDAMNNMKRVNQLIKFAYPVYRTVSVPATGKTTTAQTSKLTTATVKNTLVSQKTNNTNNMYMVASPMLMVKMTNMASQPGPYLYSSQPMLNPGKTPEETLLPTIQENGLVCKINGAVAANPDLEAGFFGTTFGVLYPKVWKISLTLNIFHAHVAGWVDHGDKVTFGHDNNNQDSWEFPYSPWGLDIHNLPNPIGTDIEDENRWNEEQRKKFPANIE